MQIVNNFFSDEIQIWKYPISNKIDRWTHILKLRRQQNLPRTEKLLKKRHYLKDERFSRILFRFFSSFTERHENKFILHESNKILRHSKPSTYVQVILTVYLQTFQNIHWKINLHSIFDEFYIEILQAVSFVRQNEMKKRFRTIDIQKVLAVFFRNTLYIFSVVPFATVTRFRAHMSNISNVYVKRLLYLSI